MSCIWSYLSGPERERRNSVSCALKLFLFCINTLVYELAKKNLQVQERYNPVVCALKLFLVLHEHIGCWMPWNW